ncbi:hypothetical protein [Roseivivax sp. CAU 1761]
MLHRLRLAALGALMLLAACAAAPGDGPERPGDVAALARAISALGPGVDRAEAARAAEIAQAYPLHLAEAWQVTDHPLVHNAKVLHGLREKGLCNDWTEAMLSRLARENFRTLSLHWASSPPAGFRVIHHSAVISARGAPREAGLVLDPWRQGGPLFWAPVDADARYDWGPPITAGPPADRPGAPPA